MHVYFVSKCMQICELSQHLKLYQFCLHLPHSRNNYKKPLFCLKLSRQPKIKSWAMKYFVELFNMAKTYLQ